MDDTRKAISVIVGILIISISGFNQETFAGTIDSYGTEVILPLGTSVPGCEETNECYLPYAISVEVGDKVTWTNDDTSAHTVTSGDPHEGPDGEFDSSLFLSGDSFSVLFHKEGTFEYYCMVHPWMFGLVNVVASQNGENPPPPIEIKLNTVLLYVADTKIRGESSLSISGEVNPIDPDQQQVSIYVFTSDLKTQIYHTSGLVGSDGSYDMNVPTGGPNWDANEGELTVLARYSDYPGETKDITYEKGEDPPIVDIGLMLTVLPLVLAPVAGYYFIMKKRKKTPIQKLRDSKLK